MNRNIFTVTVGMLALVAVMLIMGAGTGGASTMRDVTASALQAQSASRLQQPDAPLAPVTTTFTYQGYLAESGNPANGQFDFEFRLFDALTGGSQIGGLVSKPNQTVSGGTFTVPLDFGELDGTAGWLEIRVRRTGGGSFITLTPRQALTPAPYAMTLRPGAVISGTVNSSGIGGVAQTLLVYNNSQAFNAVAIRAVTTARGTNSAALRGDATDSGNGVFGISNSGNGVRGISTSDAGVRGSSNIGFGVLGGSNSATGVFGISNSGAAVIGTSNSGTGVFGTSNSGDAAHFNGDVEVIGNLSKGGGSFKIDHPLDPANKYLYHSFVESPDMMNIYNGNVTLNAKGEATVSLPDWFGALNKEFRYQLTAVGAPGPNLYVSKKVENNRFSIAGGAPGSEVSWQVTGIRKDAYAEKNRIPVEENKQGDEKGKYLYPKEQGQPESMGIDYELVKKMREDAEKAKP